MTVVHRFRHALAAVAAALACLVASGSLAQDWTIQTVAVRDLREAELFALDLTARGYDAYTEFTMSEEGLQYVRVRVGCFYGPGGAEAVASLLRAGATRDAVVVERSPGAPARGCLRRALGFVAPEEVHQPEPGVPTFIVEVAGVRGVIRFLEGRWRVLQDPAADAIPPAPPRESRFRQVEVSQRPYVRMRHDDGDFFICPGRMLAETSTAAVVEDDGVVLACIWDDETPSGDGA